MEKEKLFNILKDSEIKEEIEIIDKIYSSLENKQIVFCDTFCIHCKDGCGKCCEHFTPEISYLESLFLAYGLIIENKDKEVYDKLKESDDSIISCPLYDINNLKHHCTVYKYRPLICRLFGASASKDKNGKPVFRKCKWNDNGKDVSSEEFLSHLDSVITMDEYGRLVLDNEPNNTNLLPLKKSLMSSIEKINLIIHLYNINDK